MISRKEVLHIAKLARLGLAVKEIERYQKDLSAILDYTAKLKKADIEGISATSHPFFVKNIARKDEAEKSAQNLLGSAPETKDGYVKVKSVL